MDSHGSDCVVQVDRRKTWTDALLAFFRPRDYHVSDDEIFEILTAGSDGETVADLCAARSLTVPMYCLWKVKYRHLSHDELRKVRRRERWRGRYLLGGFLSAAVLGTGIVFGLARAHADMTVAPDSPIPVTALPRTEAGQPARGGHRQPIAALPPAPEAPPVERSSPADTPPSITEPGYKIQVAAAQSLREGRVVVEQLASAGYPAYLTRAIIGNTDVVRVRIGPFDTLAAAEEIASRLQRDGYSGAWIARSPIADR